MIGGAIILSNANTNTIQDTNSTASLARTTVHIYLPLQTEVTKKGHASFWAP